MKELYSSPEMKVVCFAPVEQLAGFEILWDSLLNSNLEPQNYAGASPNTQLDLEAGFEDAQ